MSKVHEKMNLVTFCFLSESKPQSWQYPFIIPNSSVKITWNEGQPPPSLNILSMVSVDYLWAGFISCSHFNQFGLLRDGYLHKVYYQLTCHHSYTQWNHLYVHLSILTSLFLQAVFDITTLSAAFIWECATFCSCTVISQVCHR